MNKLLKICKKGQRRVTAKIDGDRKREKAIKDKEKADKEKEEKDKGKT